MALVVTTARQGAQLATAPRRCTRRTRIRCWQTGSCSSDPGSDRPSVWARTWASGRLLITLGIQAVMAPSSTARLPALRNHARGQSRRLHRPDGRPHRRRDLPGRHQVVLVNPIFPQNHVTSSASTSRRPLVAGRHIIGLGIVLTVLFRFTRFGLATRASAETEVGALVSGLSPDRIALVNWSSVSSSPHRRHIDRPLVPLQPGRTRSSSCRRWPPPCRRFHSLGWPSRRPRHRRARIALRLRQRAPPGLPAAPAS